MSNPKRMQKLRVRQLRAIAENLYLQASRHRENQNYIVAHALYGHALAAAQRIEMPEQNENGSAFIARIQKDQQAVAEMLRSGESGPKKTPLEQARKVGQETMSQPRVESPPTDALLDLKGNKNSFPWKKAESADPFCLPIASESISN